MKVEVNSTVFSAIFASADGDSFCGEVINDMISQDLIYCKPTQSGHELLCYLQTICCN